jgi:hypothetical protein
MASDNDRKLSENFRVREFACKDGTDRVVIDERLVMILQKIRDYFKTPVHIESGYRTPAHNKAVGGAVNSDHLKGMAADIHMNENPRLVAMFAEATGVRRIGLYTYPNGVSWLHIGSGLSVSYWLETEPGYRQYPTTFLPVLRRQFFRFTNRFETMTAQTILRRTGFYTGALDGKYGAASRRAVLAFQKARRLDQDGVTGPATWRELFNV